MNISNIKKRAEQVFNENRSQLIRIFIIMMLINLIPSLFNQGDHILLSMISFGLSILFLTFNHGYVVSTLKAVRHNGQTITDEDSYVGFRRFQELFFTYFLSAIIIGGVIFILTIILTFGLFVIIGASMSSFPFTLSASHLVDANIYSQLSFILQYAPMVIILVCLMLIILMVVSYILSSYLFAMPYLLEQYNMKGNQALNESIALMKGHIWEFFKLSLSYFGWILLTGIVYIVIASLLAFIPILGTIIAATVSSVFGIYTYSVKYALSRTIFFEELAYYRYEQKSEVNNTSYTQEV